LFLALSVNAGGDAPEERTGGLRLLLPLIFGFLLPLELAPRLGRLSGSFPGSTLGRSLSFDNGVFPLQFRRGCQIANFSDTAFKHIP